MLLSILNVIGSDSLFSGLDGGDLLRTILSTHKKLLIVGSFLGVLTLTNIRLGCRKEWDHDSISVIVALLIVGCECRFPRPG